MNIRTINEKAEAFSEGNQSLKDAYIAGACDVYNYFEWKGPEDEPEHLQYCLVEIKLNVYKPLTYSKMDKCFFSLDSDVLLKDCYRWKPIE